jgi:hypothetical protein
MIQNVFGSCASGFLPFEFVSCVKAANWEMDGDCGGFGRYSQLEGFPVSASVKKIIARGIHCEHQPTFGGKISEKKH